MKELVEANICKSLITKHLRGPPPTPAQPLGIQGVTTYGIACANTLQLVKLMMLNRHSSIFAFAPFRVDIRRVIVISITNHLTL